MIFTFTQTSSNSTQDPDTQKSLLIVRKHTSQGWVQLDYACKHPTGSASCIRWRVLSSCENIFTCAARDYFRRFKKLLRRRRGQRLHILATNLAILSSHLVCLSLSVKISRKWLWDTASNLKYNFYTEWSVVVHVIHTTQNLLFHVVVLQRTAKKCTNNYNAHHVHSHCSAH